MKLMSQVLFITLFCGVLGNMINKSNIITSPYLLCYDINVYVSKTLLSTDDDYIRMRSNIKDILLSAKRVYSWHRIELRVSSIVFFNPKDPFTISNDYNEILTEFGYYIGNSTNRADAYVLLVDIEMPSTKVVGRAYLGTACTNNALAVVQGGKALQNNPQKIGYAIAHELGHILNMKHVTNNDDGCDCAFDKDACIMRHELFEWQDNINSPPFHTCSIKYLLENNFKCLTHCNTFDNKFDICGDGVNIKSDTLRSCDCGTKDTCDIRDTSECCDYKTCRLKTNSQCSEEICCHNCHYTPGKLCRESNGECDLIETCNDYHADCPKDLYVYNGKPCGNNGYCFDGSCSDKDQVCQQMFKKSEGVRYSKKCYDFIQSFITLGYCNDDQLDNLDSTAKLICESGKNICRHVWCEMDVVNDQFYTSLNIQNAYEEIVCYTINDPIFFAPNGFVCDSQNVCYNGECGDIENFKTVCPPCPTGKICSNEGTCVPYPTTNTFIFSNLNGVVNG